MDILDRLVGHDIWTTRQLLHVCQQLPDELLDRRFEFGQETLRRTFAHLIGNMETWTGLMVGGAVLTGSGPERHDESMDVMIERFEAVAVAFTAIAKRLRDEDRLDDFFVDVLDAPPRKKTFGGAIVHLTTHSMHHRAQVLAMLDITGISHDIEGDALGWERRLRGGWDEDLPSE